MNLAPHLDPVPIQVWADFNSQQEVECLPFKLNLGDVSFRKRTPGPDLLI